MEEQVKAPETTQDVTPKEPVVETPKEDIVTRASKVIESDGPQEPEQSIGFDPKEIEKIQDPQAREFAQKAYSEMNRGLQAKFREVADERKMLKEQQAVEQSWTPERLASELKKDDFMSSAQFLNQQQTVKNQSGGELNDEEWSALKPEERQQMVHDRQQVQILSNEVNSMRRQQEDSRLKTKYGNYDAQAVTKLQSDLYAGKYKAGPEDIWKVRDYENAVKRAYSLGKQDRQAEMTEKAGAISTNGVNTTPVQDIPSREPKESGAAYFKRLALRRIAEMGKR